MGRCQRDKCLWMQEARHQPQLDVPSCMAAAECAMNAPRQHKAASPPLQARRRTRRRARCCRQRARRRMW